MNFDKTGSYISAEGYTTGYYKDLSIHNLRNLCLLHNHTPPTPDGNYLELGFGQGLSIVAHAKMSSAQIFGCDLYPSHVLNAQNLADDMQAQVTLWNKSFSEVLQSKTIPNVDYIVAHGVWSWVGDEIKHQICAIIERCLNPGGVFYCSFNNFAGWAPLIPIQQFMRHYIAWRKLDVYREPARFGEVIDALETLLQSNNALSQDERVVRHVKSLRKRDKSY
ncbi:MAG: class I SAM-dependent methyltransferase, partial [Pseudomonadota bacterium]